MTKTEEKCVTLHSGERAAHSDRTFAVARKTNNRKMKIIAFTVFITSLRKLYNTLIINMSILHVGILTPNRLENSAWRIK